MTRSRAPRTRILPYKAGSRSARALSEGLRVLRLKLQGSRFVARNDDTLINWGSTTVPDVHGFVRVINHPHSVDAASNKLSAFNNMYAAGVNIPEYTAHADIALRWTEGDGAVVCRTLTRANSGRGIIIARTPEEVVPAPLYTKYIKKVREYRVHVFNEGVIDEQIKRRSREVPDERVNWQIRSHDNGFVFCREDLQQNERRSQLAIAAVQALELDFGAVDIIYNEQQDQYYVLEVNTAPGLEGSTLEAYIQAFRSVI